MKLGIIGAGGYWGQKILRIAAELNAVELKYCSVHSNVDRLLGLVSDAFPEERRPSVTLSQPEMVSSREIDALIVASPAETHYAIAKDALLHKKHVFVEKPMCLSSAEAGVLVRLAREQRRVLFVDHTYLHSRCLSYMKARVEEGFLGDPLFFHSNRSQIGIYRKHSVLWDLAPHDLSIIYFLFPEEQIDSTSLTSWNHFGDAVSDAAYFTIHFASGFNASGFLTWCHPKWARDIAVVGTKGMLLFENNTTVTAFTPTSSQHRLPNKADWQEQEKYSPDDNPLENALTAFYHLAERPGIEQPQHMRPEFSVRILATIEDIERAQTSAVVPGLQDLDHAVLTDGM